MQMIIASRLTDGRVVFMGEGGTWVEHIEQGAVHERGADAARSLLDAERAAVDNLIVDPYLIDILEDDGVRRPIKVREAIRAFGPSVRTDLVSG